MPKSLVVDPTEVRASGTAITSPGLPVNQYRRDFSAEIDHYGGDELTAMLRDMIVIREFESMLNAAKTVGEYHGTHYAHAGPAHLGIGQEAAYVGQAAALDVEDMVFGSHRSHGEILAKCLSATRKLDPSRLERIMADFLGGETLRLSEKIGHADLRELAVNFVLFGTLAEIFARRAGFNRGMGGSMHGFFAPFGSMPNNAIVGGSAPIAMGAALFKRINRRPGIVVANIGDASLGCGPVWEAMNFAAMGQFRTLWRDADGGNPPILFNIFNNFYGMG
ncbi:MAG: dehydrogenase, partial [Propionibacteriaceae bacterium]|nr:dehydrogenase [Propionibacteriaceae bacterium]